MSILHRWPLLSKTDFKDLITGTDEFTPVIANGGIEPTIDSVNGMRFGQDYLYIDNKYNDWKGKVFSFWIRPLNRFTLLNKIMGWEMVVDLSQNDRDAITADPDSPALIDVENVPLYTTDFKFTDGMDYHIVYSESDRKVYINKVNYNLELLGTYNVTVFDRFSLGNFSNNIATDGASQIYNGYISDFRIWDEVPTESEIEYIYNCGKNNRAEYIIKDKNTQVFYFYNPNTSAWEPTPSASTSDTFQLRNYGMPFNENTDVLSFNVPNVDEYSVVMHYVDDTYNNVNKSAIIGNLEAYPLEQKISVHDPLSYIERDTLTGSNISEIMNTSISSFVYALYNVHTDKYYAYTGSIWEEINPENLRTEGMTTALLEAGMRNNSVTKKFLIDNGIDYDAPVPEGEEPPEYYPDNEWKLVISAYKTEDIDSELNDMMFSKDREIMGYRIYKNFDYEIFHKEAHFSFYENGKFKVNY